MSEWKETEVGRIPNDWQLLAIGDFCDVTKLAGFEYTEHFDYVEDGEIIALRALNIREGRLDLSDIKRIYKKVSELLPRSKLFKDDILFTYVGANIGQFALVPENDKYHLAPNICRIRCNYENSSYYLYSYFRTNYFRESLENFSHGSSQPTLPMGSIRKIPIPLPPLPEQKAIASVLSSVDDKIELLNRQNETLEAMAETLFRQWFVVEAKDDCEEGVIPTEFDFTMGLSPPGNTYNEEEIGIPLFQGNADFEFRFPKKRVYTTDPRRYAEKFDTLISVRAPVGAQNMANEKCCIGRGVAAFRYKHNNSFYTYTYFKLKSLMNEIQQYNETGTVFGSISKSDFQSFEITIPPYDLIEGFQNRVKPIDDKIIRNCFQIRTLEKLRDKLIPKLMSGEIRVKI
jgi:type I restriction enzyme, S subunit